MFNLNDLRFNFKAKQWARHCHWHYLTQRTNVQLALPGANLRSFQTPLSVSAAVTFWPRRKSNTIGGLGSSTVHWHDLGGCHTQASHPSRLAFSCPVRSEALNTPPAGLTVLELRVKTSG